MKSILADAVELAGGQHAWSRKTGIPQSVVSLTLNDQREMSESIVNALGYVTQTVCIPMKGQNHA
ncbi:hypothetical protein CFR80_16865 [Komagataeibacter oboediens]|uniref:Transcriptional regulator n=2 Tax=Komagataeibacter oboediens TaxID=65958 RepID=A0A318QF15_9PROT|nr:hypothetical protein CFR80_16865 [Komagataeibacter oboediens]